MKTFYTLFCAFIITSTSIAQNALNEKQLEKKLKQLQETTQTVGFSVAIVKGNTLIYAKGFGHKDLEKQEAVDAETLFAIGSASKAFTTALLGIMEEEKELSFLDSPRKYIPELEFYNDELNNNINLLDMISHRTGLPRHDFSWYLFPSEDKNELLKRIKYHEPFTDIRMQWHYNNFMYLTQGMIVEKLTGKSWEDNIRERFFKPLQMTSSNVSIPEMEKAPNISKGFSLEKFTTNKVMPYYNIAAISPAGSINSSAKDMASWVKVWLNKGKLNDTQVLPEAYVKKAMNPLMMIGAGIGDEKFPDQHLNSYGFGWFTSSYKGHYRMEHGGNIDGFSANVALFPTDNLGIVVLTNQNGSALPSLVRNTISDMILKLDETDWASEYSKQIEKIKKQQAELEKDKDEKAVANSIPTHSLEEYTGNYLHKGYGTMTIEVKNDSLWVSFPREKAYLKHTHYDIFEPMLVEDGKVNEEANFDLNFNFKSNDMGDISGVHLKLEPTLDPLFFERTPLEVEVSTDHLNQYVGEYSLYGTILKVSIKDEALKLLVPGQPEYTLVAVRDNEFVIKGLSGYKAEFSKNGDKHDLVLHQPNGTFTAVKQ